MNHGRLHLAPKFQAPCYHSIMDDKFDEDTVDEIRRQLESIVDSFVSAINHEDFDSRSPAWSHIGSTFRVTPFLTLAGEQPGNLTLEEWLAGMQETAKPHHIYTMAGLSTYVDVRRGKAEIFGNHRDGSAHDGIWVPVVSYFVFDRDDDDFKKWKCVRIKLTRGFEADSIA